MAKYTDDHDLPTDVLKLLPTGGGGNILVGYKGYLKEIAFRRYRNKMLCISGGTPFDIPSWESLEIYRPNE